MCVCTYACVHAHKCVHAAVRKQMEQLLLSKRWGDSGNSVRLYFWGAPKSLQMVTAAMKLKDAYSLEGKL